MITRILVWVVRRIAASRHRIAATAFAVMTAALVVHGQRDLGIARDETVYMAYGSGYADWWIAAVTGKDVVNEQAITARFGGPGATDNNREHPPLLKTLFGLSERLFHDRLGWAGEVTAYRLPSAALHGLLVALVFLMVHALWGWAEGVIAGVALLLLPRLFFHAGLACFDAPIAALWFATIYAYWRALASRRWCLVLGITFGLALATKHNALILPFVLMPHLAWISRLDLSRRLRERMRWAGEVRGVRRALRSAQAALRLLVVDLWGRQPWVAPALAVLGPVTLVALWPWLWFDTVDHVRGWISFHLHHVHYNFEYLGENWNHPPFPWHVAIVTTLVTTPVATLVAAALGTGAWIARARRKEVPDPARAPGLLLALSASAAMAPFFLGSTPIFGAEKHWAPAMASLAIAAGVGVVGSARLASAWLVGAVPRLAPRTAAVDATAIALVATAVIGAAAIETARAQPYALSHYNAIAGGAPGGADLGMNRQFWGYAARGVLPFLRSIAPRPDQPPDPVYTHDASPAWGIYRRLGLVPATLPDAGHEQAGVTHSRIALVIHERHFARHDYLVWAAYGSVQPAFVLRAEGVPIVSVYVRRAR